MRTERRCTYCLEVKPTDQFTQVGDHVIPLSWGGIWIDPNSCEPCNSKANRGADELVTKDPLIVHLRDGYGISNPHRHGETPAPARFAVRVPDVGVVKVVLGPDGPTFTPGMAPADVERLGLDSEDRIRELVAALLQVDVEATYEGLLVAQAAREHAAHPTPPLAWGRFIAKLGLAAGREAFGDAWLDTEHARRLSATLLAPQDPSVPPRAHHPPVDRIWPYEPPGHRLWIEPIDGVSTLMAVLFGQVIDSVVVNDAAGAAAAAEADPLAYNAWIIDPLEPSLHRSTFPAVWSGSAAARLTNDGRDVVMLPDGSLFIADGDRGPVQLPGVATFPADSPTHALQLLAEVRGNR